MRPSRRRLAFAALLAAASLGLAAVVWLAPQWVRQPRVSDVWPIDLSRPGGWLIDRQLAELATDSELCRRALVAPLVEHQIVADRPAADGCGWSNAVRTTRFGGAELRVEPLACGMAAALAFWIEHEVQPAALQHLGQRIAAVEHRGSYACRNIRGARALSSFRSQHASANAIDIWGFRLADGRRLAVKSGWGRGTAESRFLRAVHRGACNYFRVVIGPDYNAAHHDHFHLDRGFWRACR